MGGVVVSLNEAEQRLADYIAKKRYSMNRQTGAQDRKIGPQSNFEMERDGIGGEIAFCKMMNIYPDLDTLERPLADAYTHRGDSVDVKTTKFRNGKLAVPLWKIHKQSDLYALMICNHPDYIFVGMITAEELFREDNIGNLGHGATYVVPQERLIVHRGN